MTISMRRTALTVYGGSLSSLYDSRRFEDGKRSRSGNGCRTRKDFRINGSKNYRPWRKS